MTAVASGRPARRGHLNGVAAAPNATRILHIAETIAGGIASFFEEIAPYQNEAFGKANVTFLIPSGSEHHLPRIDPAQILTFSPASRKPRGLTAFRRAGEEAIRRIRPDIVHLHSSFAGAVIRAFASRRPGAPRTIYCPHGWAFAMDNGGTKQRVYAAIERALARRTDLIITNSENERELAIHFGLAAEKIRTVKNGIAWSPAAMRPDRTGPLRIAFIGRHDRQKGIDILLDTIERFPLPDIHFDIVGERVIGAGDDNSRRDLDNVTWHGWLARTDTMKLLEDVDAVVMPSRWDAAPIVAIEAMRAGVPVIASDRGALPEIVRHGVGGYIFELDDPDSLGRLLQRLNRAELDRLGTSARTRWESDYVSEDMNRRTVEAYADVLSRRAEFSGRTADFPGFGSTGFPGEMRTE